MARARNIKPGIMANEELAELSHSHRLLFIYLWMLADREGRLEDRPKRIKAEAFPYDDGLDVESMLDDLVSAGFIQRYEQCGVRAVQVLNFAKHQTPHSREKASVIPAPVLVDGEDVAGADLGGAEGTPGTGQGGADESPTPLAVRPDSLILRSSDSLIPEEELAPQEQRSAPESEQPLPTDRPKRGSRLPEDWTLPGDWLTWALTERPEFSEDAMRRVGDSFGDHWRSATGKNATKLDWFATWRNWVRNQRPPFGAQRAGPPPASPHLGLDQTNHEEGLERQADGTYRIARP
ncbi:hypothetical protein [Pseudomonas aeruginosa]|uniref:hypothetical protein n=1 Tax=Pseudomonas aeruginosa TaxID=287 RepID=UPI000EAF05D2|nr:hypothetical protein [Pseudomonas aeruginosa]EKV6889121.1 hypothetical protein [Pseudomonas aeruginosa]ELV1370746.1 hypothetical protein [Pseudomonas aeruginosa]MCX3415638.1 hypothetical protein [Pseudomonas aeruginosa]MDE9771472.1 hypothetical protein [Pseudomonas aeruginosa]TSC43097.1 hypothetical protein FNV45_32055 [Pseudomonas aeruginosa]